MNRFPIEPNTGTLRLDRNECIVPSIISRLLELSDIDSLDYAQYTSALDVIEKLSIIFDCTLSNIYVDNGSEQVLKTLIHVIDCNEWVTTTPTFEMFPFYVSSLGKKIKNINFTYTDTFNINLSTSSTDAGLYLVSPHNPTGYTTTFREVIQLCEMYKYVILDQAYITPTQRLKLRDLPNNLIIVRTFSKMGGLTGMRFGFCVTKNTNIVESLNQLRPMYLNTVTLKLVNKLIETPNLLEDIYLEFNKVKSMINFSPIAEAGNFILLKDVSYYKNYKLKEYIIDGKAFFRLTLCDLKTFYTL